jgi:glycosyltransferase involved in cell wall biosynthesis
MHILHLIKTSEGAGWALHLMQELKEHCPEISFSVAIPFGGKYTNEYLELCRDVYEFDYTINTSIYQRGKKLQKIVGLDKPDVIHSWFTQTTLYARLFLRHFNIPRLFQVVGPLHLETQFFKWCDIKSSNKNDYWIATSKYILDKYKQSGVGEHRLFLNYAFVDVLRLLESKKDCVIKDLKSKYNLPVHFKLIGTASYIYSPKLYEKTGVKGHEYLLKAFKRILTKRQDVALIIAGGPFENSSEYVTKLKRMAAEIDGDRIIFTGEYKHVYEIISNFDVFVYLSKSDNLGGVFESLLFEVPTVSSNRGALPELVVNNETGYTVNLENIDEIVEKILQSLETPRGEFTKNGHNKVLQTFEKEAILKQALQIYQQVSN